MCSLPQKQFLCLSAVIMSNYYDLPFNDILDWNAFSVILKEDDVPITGEILKGMPEDMFEKMRQNVLKVDNILFIICDFCHCIPKKLIHRLLFLVTQAHFQDATVAFLINSSVLKLWRNVYLDNVW